MFEQAPEGLVFRPLANRVRLLAPCPPNAIATQYDRYDALDLFFSELRDDFIAGRVKRVLNSYKADDRSIFASFSIIHSSPGEERARAAAHRDELLRSLRSQYKNAVVRFAAANPKNARRTRQRINAALATDAPEPGAIEPFFVDHPDALAKAAGIRNLLDYVTSL